MTYQQIRVDIRSNRYVRLNREVTFDELHSVLKGAVQQNFLKEKKKVFVWVKGFAKKRLIMYTPEL